MRGHLHCHIVVLNQDLKGNSNLILDLFISQGSVIQIKKGHACGSEAVFLLGIPVLVMDTTTA